MDPFILKGIVFAGFLYSVVLHEVAHGYLAEQLGDPTARYAGRLTLNPLPHLDPIGSFLLPLILIPTGFVFGYAKPVPYNPNRMRDRRRDPLKVMAAGPVTNILLALLLGLLVRLLVALPTIPVLMIAVLTAIVFINLLLAVFNLIPIPPFDGRFLIGLFSPVALLRAEITIARMGGAGMFIGLLVGLFVILPIVFPVVPVLTALLTGLTPGEVSALLGRVF
jgi:Zn-dependent protease